MLTGFVELLFELLEFVSWLPFVLASGCVLLFTEGVVAESGSIFTGSTKSKSEICAERGGDFKRSPSNGFVLSGCGGGGCGTGVATVVTGDSLLKMSKSFDLPFPAADVFDMEPLLPPPPELVGVAGVPFSESRGRGLPDLSERLRGILSGDMGSEEERLGARGEEREVTEGL
jgi:hypothetical protein